MLREDPWKEVPPKPAWVYRFLAKMFPRHPANIRLGELRKFAVLDYEDAKRYSLKDLRKFVAARSSSRCRRLNRRECAKKVR